MYFKKTICIATILLFAAQCGPSTTSRYPSYEQTIAQYVPPGEYKAVRINDPGACPSHAYCDYPRIWYHGHWVYYYGGRWIYWDHGYWYHYPAFYIHYYNGYPYVYRGPARSISKGSSQGRGSRRGRRIRPDDHHKTPPKKIRGKPARSKVIRGKPARK